ncbi:MAG: MFS transporter [Syntrophales bacterium]
MFLRAHTINKITRSPRKSAIKNGLAALSFHKIINLLGASLFGLFLPIFLFEFYDYRAWPVFLYGAVYYLGAVLTQPLGAKLMTKIGLKKAMILGVFLYVGFFASLLLKDVCSVWLVTVLSLLFFIAWHITYWVPFHTAFAEAAPRGKLGSIIGFLAAGRSVIGIAVPILSGWIITSFGYSAIMVFAASVILLSAIPIFFVKVGEEKFEYGFFETFKILFSKKERSSLVLYAAEGSENSIGFLVWPIFIFLIFQGRYLEVGAVATAVVAVSVVLEIIVGRLSDRFNPQKLFRVGAGMTSFGWLMRMFVNTAANVFFVGIFHSLSYILMNTPFEAIMYTRAADAGHYIDEYTVLREMALGIGRATTLLFLIGLVSLVGFPSAFLVAALATIVFGVAVRVSSGDTFFKNN